MFIRIITIYAPVIYTALCIMFWMRAYTLRGEVGGGWALEFPSFLDPVTGLEKTRVFLIKTQPSGFFGFLGVFAQNRGFLGFFFSFKNTFRCIQTLNYNHSY
jgi:hypothetical protein